MINLKYYAIFQTIRVTKTAAHLLLLFILISQSSSVLAANPTLLWSKYITGEVVAPCRSSLVSPSEWKGHCDISQVFISPDGKFSGVVTTEQACNQACNPTEIKLFNENGDIDTINSGGLEFKGIIGEENNLVAIGSPFNKFSIEVDFLSASNGKSLKNFQFDIEFGLSSSSISPNGKFIILVDGNKFISLYSSQGEELYTVDFKDSGQIQSLSISNSGDVVIFSSDEYGGQVFLYGKEGEIIFNKNYEPTQGLVKISSDGNRIVLALNDFKSLASRVIYLTREGTEIWNKDLWEEGTVDGDIGGVEISYDGNYLLYASFNENLTIFDEMGGEIGTFMLGTDYGLTKKIEHLSVSEIGDRILFSTDYRRVYYLDNSANVKKKLSILANSIDYELNRGLFDYIRERGLEPVHVKPSAIENYKEEGSILILGGPDAPEGIGEIVTPVLMNSEQNEIRAEGSKKMYKKINVWTIGQNVTLIAGSTREDTKQAVLEYMDQLEL